MSIHAIQQIADEHAFKTQHSPIFRFLFDEEFRSLTSLNDRESITKSYLILI